MEVRLCVYGSHLGTSRIRHVYGYIDVMLRTHSANKQRIEQETSSANAIERCLAERREFVPEGFPLRGEVVSFICVQHDVFCFVDTVSLSTSVSFMVLSSSDI